MSCDQLPRAPTAMMLCRDGLCSPSVSQNKPFLPEVTFVHTNNKKGSSLLSFPLFSLFSGKGEHALAPVKNLVNLPPRLWHSRMYFSRCHPNLYFQLRLHPFPHTTAHCIPQRPFGALVSYCVMFSAWIFWEVIHPSLSSAHAASSVMLLTTPHWWGRCAFLYSIHYCTPQGVPIALTSPGDWCAIIFDQILDWGQTFCDFIFTTSKDID